MTLVDEPLFDLPDGAVVVPVPEEPLTRGERRRRVVATRIATGYHPLAGVIAGKLRIHPAAGAHGLTCGSCKWREYLNGGSRSYPKCRAHNDIRATHSDSSDVRASWPACTDYERVPR